MRYYQLTEKHSRNVVVVDIQPAYNKYIQTQMDLVELMSWLNNQRKILMFVNAEETDLTEDSIIDIQDYWVEHEFSINKWSDVSIVDKGYGHFRSWMDQGVSDKTIIKVIRELYKQNVYDTSSLFGGIDNENYYAKLKNLVGNDWKEWMIDGYDSDNLNIMWTKISQLKNYSGSYLVGGAKDECLKEVALLMNAFNFKYKLVDKFIYH